MSEYLNGDGLILSAHYEQTMTQTVLPFLKEREKESQVQGDGGKPLYCVSYQADAPKGTVLIVHGFTENAYKFAEVIYSLLQNGFSVAAYDQRGHGRSWHDPKVTDPSLTHVGDFNEYERDLTAVCDAVLKSMPKPWMVFAHSMGGAVTSLFLERHPDVFSRAALCAPMIAANRGGIPYAMGKLICRAAKLFGQGKKRIFMSKPYAGPEDFATSCATGRERFDWYDKVKAENREFHNNGPTYSWTLESLKVTKWLLAEGAPERIACPVLLFTADEDNSVLSKEQEMFIRRVKNGRRVFVKGSRHEIYRSADDVLFPWWHAVLEFLKSGIQ